MKFLIWRRHSRDVTDYFLLGTDCLKLDSWCESFGEIFVFTFGVNSNAEDGGITFLLNDATYLPTYISPRSRIKKNLPLTWIKEVLYFRLCKKREWFTTFSSCESQEKVDVLSSLLFISCVELVRKFWGPGLGCLINLP